VFWGGYRGFRGGYRLFIVCLKGGYRVFGVVIECLEVVIEYSEVVIDGLEVVIECLVVVILYTPPNPSITTSKTLYNHL